MMRLRLAAAVLLLVAYCGGHPSLADAPPAAPAEPNGPAQVQAHPALWTLHSAHATIFLFGSLHALPPNYVWETDRVAQAIDKADVFVFEIPDNAESQAQINALVAKNGYLPAGTRLRDMLNPQARSDFDKDLAQLNLPLSYVNTLRPWLASLVMTFAQLAQEHSSPDSGVDVTLMRQAAANHRELRYLETVEQQMALLVPSDAKLELEEFESDLKDTGNEKSGWPTILDAWSHGDVVAIDTNMNEGFVGHPDARKALFEDRNHAWVKQIEAMLGENKTFFITVGAGHLAGRDGVPNLLRADGISVDGP